ncbi:glyoxylate reductase [Microthyrium microscopicum]|uniref:Glyoxylate reductase n=1 Tax=Microthyrium microscopicum TaxID=703497 RepID=A0A6A6U879_9PEZI|nr:glyoxylate reductase [Microthyrium microscopicum]
MAKPKVLLLGEIEHAHDAWKALGELAELSEPESKNRAGFLEECKSGKLDGVLVCFRTFNSISITGMFDEELIQCLPKSVKYVCHNGAGYDQVDIQACTARSIQVSNTPTAVDDATADVNMFLILGALRGFNAGMLALRQGDWRGRKLPPLGHDPQGKTLGILGMGGIGRNLKKKADGFGMKTIYHNRNRLEPDMEAGAEYVSFEQLLTTSDVLSLNLPLNKHTRHIISTPEFNKMKRGVIVVNTARGAVIDEAALVEALNSGQVGSCGLDVYEEEPKIHPGLVANPNVLLVPHMGTWTVETQTKMEEWTISNVRCVLEKGRLKNIVPEQASLMSS